MQRKHYGVYAIGVNCVYSTRPYTSRQEYSDVLVNSQQNLGHQPAAQIGGIERLTDLHHEMLRRLRIRPFTRIHDLRF